MNFDKENSPFTREYTPESINKMVNIARKSGFFVTYNHPCWSLENYEQYINYDGFNAVEVYNHAVEREGFQSTATYVYDDILRCGKKLFAVAADDTHDPEGKRDSFGGFVMIKAEGLKYELITEALFNGDFYASTGPLFFELYIEDENLHVRTSDVASISITTDDRKTKQALAKDTATINEAIFPLTFPFKYFRISIKDNQGNYAYTNAFFKEDL